MNEIKAKEGYYLSDKNKTVFYKFVKGANVNADNYIEITEEEAHGIIKHTEAVRDIDTLDKIDDCAYKAGLIAECMNIVPMTNKEIVARTSLLPKWEDYIGKSLIKGFKVQYKNKPYKVLKGLSNIVNIHTPDITKSEYGLISEHNGTKDDPIPYEHWMLIEKDVYYTQNGKLYIGLQNAPNGYAADLNTLSTLVKEVKD